MLESWWKMHSVFGTSQLPRQKFPATLLQCAGVMDGERGESTLKDDLTCASKTKSKVNLDIL